MDDNDGKKQGELAAGYMKLQCELHGVASVRVSDGQMFMLSTKKLRELLVQCDEKGSDFALIFVKSGSTLQEN